jgi:hypothetical protein
MKKAVKIINSIVFIFFTFVVMSIFYEGLVLEWYSFVALLIIISDIFFIIATILNIIVNRKIKIIFFFNIFSICIICVAIILKIINVDYPKWSILIWNFFILYFYGVQFVFFINKYIQLKIKTV